MVFSSNARWRRQAPPFNASPRKSRKSSKSARSVPSLNHTEVEKAERHDRTVKHDDASKSPETDRTLSSATEASSSDPLHEFSESQNSSQDRVGLVEQGHDSMEESPRSQPEEDDRPGSTDLTVSEHQTAGHSGASTDRNMATRDPKPTYTCIVLIALAVSGLCLSFAMYLGWGRRFGDYGSGATQGTYIFTTCTATSALAAFKHTGNCRCRIWGKPNGVPTGKDAIELHQD